MEELSIGTMVRFGVSPEESFTYLKSFGLHSCQLTAPPASYLFGDEGKENTEKLKAAIKEYGINVTSLFISFPNQNWRDPIYSIGLVPEHTRAARLVWACRSVQWGAELGIRQIASHVGDLPKDPNSDFYKRFVTDMQMFIKLLGSNGQVLCYETGMENAAGLKQLMENIGEENQRLNFDPANLLIYNQDDPANMLKELGDKVAHVHCKDANRPCNGMSRGKETPLGDGETNFAELFRTLYRSGFRGPLTIEREIAPGPERDADTRKAVALLEQLKAECAAM